jgi:S-methylmethionine-dependent homocysteine/selenocysteine methylase
MAKYRKNLPLLSGDVFLTDGGLETKLLFKDGIELPEFAAFDLLKDGKGEQVLKEYFRVFAQMARKYRVGLLLESATWRANPDWGKKIGYEQDDLNSMNRKAIELLEEIRNEYEDGQTRFVISGCIGPRGDGYMPSAIMTAEEAQQYHYEQIKTFSETRADLVSAYTINYVDEAIGIVKAAQSVDMPVVISFTVETDGKLPTGQTLKQAIELVDAATNNGPVYYMINCAHPTHFEYAVAGNEPWLDRIHAVRANASCKSHAELDDSTELDEGNPRELGDQFRKLKTRLKKLNVLGGCCGTDHRHIDEIAKACVAV